MSLDKTKWFTLAVAICFAILQALQPFIHAHLDSDHPIQNTGFHVGDEHEENYSPLHSDGHAVSSVPHASHTISVASGIKQEVDANLFIHAVIAAIWCFCIIIASSSKQWLYPAFHIDLKKSLRRRLPASRAPPQL